MTATKLSHGDISIYQNPTEDWYSISSKNCAKCRLLRALVFTKLMAFIATNITLETVFNPWFAHKPHILKFDQRMWNTLLKIPNKSSVFPTILGAPSVITKTIFWRSILISSNAISFFFKYRDQCTSLSTLLEFTYSSFIIFPDLYRAKTAKLPLVCWWLVHSPTLWSNEYERQVPQLTLKFFLQYPSGTCFLC